MPRRRRRRALLSATALLIGIPESNPFLIADVGQDRREEVDVETVRGARGANFGWSIYDVQVDYVDPVAGVGAEADDAAVIADLGQVSRLDPG